MKASEYTLVTGVSCCGPVCSGVGCPVLMGVSRVQMSLGRLDIEGISLTYSRPMCDLAVICRGIVHTVT